MSLAASGGAKFDAQSVMRLKPMFDRVLVKSFEPGPRKVGGIVLPESSQTPFKQATVISVGEGRRNKKDGSFIPLSIKKGDKVVCSEFGGQTFKVENDTYSIYREDDILCKLE